MPLTNPPNSSFSGPLGFFGATPSAQISAYTNSSGVAGARTLASYTAQPCNSAYSGGLLDLLQAARLVDLNTVRTAYENLRVMTEAAVAQHNQLVTDLKTYGLIA